METFETLNDVLKELKAVSKYQHNSGCGLSIQRINKFLAEFVNPEDENATIVNLVESHTPVVRHKTAMRFRMMLDKDDLTAENKSLLERLIDILIGTKCPTEIGYTDCMETICSRVAEMSKEWTIIQITSSTSDTENQNIDPDKFETNPLYVTIFNCGQSNIKPFSIKISEPRDNVERNKLEVMDEMRALIKMNKDTLTTSKTFVSQKMKVKYYGTRKEIERNLRNIISNMENMWLKEWRCLLIGKYQDQTVDNKIRSSIDDFLRAEYPSTDFSPKIKELMCYLTKGTSYISLKELKSGTKYCLPNGEDKDIKKVSKFLKDLGEKLALKKKIRQPVILVIDEYLDILPWEMVDVLQEEPVSRVPSFHFAYFLYKLYEKDIDEGYKIMSKFDRGTYIVNPDRDLERMEARMMSFYNYWVPKWTGIHDRKPTDTEFFDLLTKADIFAYNGHGNGAHIMPIEQLQKAFVRAVVLLFGCGSTRIVRQGPQAENCGSYHMYLISRCPCVVGMLWEVTDLDTDVLTSEFISRWIPSEAPLHWRHVNKSEWKNAATKNLRFDNDGALTWTPEGCKLYHPELQRALSAAKKQCVNILTKASCVVRGLPVKIIRK